jgi:lysyl-tRNA synthetase class 2
MNSINKLKTWQKIRQNPQTIATYLAREKVIDGIRAFFKGEGFHEVDTPLLVQSPGTEPYLDVFVTELVLADERKMAGYLLTSPEYAMKKLLVAGLPKIFTICKSFRNGEGIGPMHNHEFTILEWYRAEADYQDSMVDCENLFIEVAKMVRPDFDIQRFNYLKRMFDLTVPWPRISVARLFEKYVGVDADVLTTDALVAVAKKKGLQADNWDDAFNVLLMNYIEPELVKMNTPVFMYDYPVQQAALAKRSAHDKRFAERFELYFAGVEIANAFSELTDAKEQAQRFEEELALRDKLGKTEYKMDEDFIAALRAGMPESGGVALGVDRLIMIMANGASIKETMLFPIEELFGLE